MIKSNTLSLTNTSGVMISDDDTVVLNIHILCYIHDIVCLPVRFIISCSVCVFLCLSVGVGVGGS